MEEDINFVKERKKNYSIIHVNKSFFWVCKRNEEERHEIIILYIYNFFFNWEEK